MTKIGTAAGGSSAKKRALSPDSPTPSSTRTSALPVAGSAAMNRTSAAASGPMSTICFAISLPATRRLTGARIACGSQSYGRAATIASVSRRTAVTATLAGRGRDLGDRDANAVGNSRLRRWRPSRPAASRSRRRWFPGRSRSLQTHWQARCGSGCHPPSGVVAAIALNTPPRSLVGGTTTVGGIVERDQCDRVGGRRALDGAPRRLACAVELPGADRLSDVSRATTVTGTGSAAAALRNTAARTPTRAAPAPAFAAPAESARAGAAASFARTGAFRSSRTAGKSTTSSVRLRNRWSTTGMATARVATRNAG